MLIGGLDGYSFRARWMPCVLVAVPLALALATWVPAFKLSHWVGVPLLAAVAAAVSQLARRAGRTLQTRLWREWGGPPTTHVLKNGSERIQSESLQRYRGFIAQLLPDTPLPTAEEATAMPAPALAGRYTAVTNALINRTRDKKEFALLYSENVTYGFWRNLRALAGLGRGLAVVALLVAGCRLATLLDAVPTAPATAAPVAVAVQRAAPEEPPREEVALTIFAMAAAAVSFCFFKFKVSDELVRRAGFDYADRLVEASEQLVAKGERTRGHDSRERSE